MPVHRLFAELRKSLRGLPAAVTGRNDSSVQGSQAVPKGGHPRLSAAILTKNSAPRLPRLISQLRAFADEIVIGVDAASSDDTLDVARRWGDRVYRFALTEHTGAARLLVLEYATGDWILSIDDDELLEEGFAEAVAELIVRPEITHAWFPRKWIVSSDPCRYAHAPHWYPDWQLRLFRNDAALIHKPDRAHSGYYIPGLGIRTAKASILHFEPLLLSSEDRQDKLRRYAQLGGSKEAELQFNIPPGVTTLPATLPLITIGQPTNRGDDSDLAIHSLPRRAQPRWGCKILSVDAPQTALPGESLIFRAHVENTGGLAWWPSTGGRHAVNLGNHLFDASGTLLDHGRGRSAVLQIVAPGETSVIIDKFAAPSVPGTYMLEWDMVSEGECWFASLGCETVRTALAVVDPERGDPVAPTTE